MLSSFNFYTTQLKTINFKWKWIYLPIQILKVLSDLCISFPTASVRTSVWIVSLFGLFVLNFIIYHGFSTRLCYEQGRIHDFRWVGGMRSLWHPSPIMMFFWGWQLFDGALSWGGAKSHRPTPVIAPSYELSSTVSSNRALEFLAFSSKSGKKD